MQDRHVSRHTHYRLIKRDRSRSSRKFRTKRLQRGHQLFEINPEEVQTLQSRLERQVGEGRILSIQADVSKRGDVRSMFDMIIEKFGKIDVLINNARLNLDGPFLEMTDEQWDRVIAINLTGTFLCSQEFALRFNSEHGHIINVGASTGFRGRKNGANYCSSKAGVITLTKCLALELAPNI